MSGGPRFHVPVGIVALAVPPDAPVIGETYFDTGLSQLRSWDGTVWVGTSSDTGLDADFVNVPGDGMTGELVLPDQVTVPPSAPAVVAAKGYVDQLVTVSGEPPVAPPARDGLIWSVVGVKEWLDPSYTPGLGLWLEADAIPGAVEGAPITAWPDQSSAHYAVIPDPAAPTWRAAGVNGAPSVYFNGSQRLLIKGWGTALSGQSEYTLFLISSSENMSNWPCVLTAPTNTVWNWLIEYDMSTHFYWGHRNGQYNLYATSFASGQVALMTFHMTAAGPKFYKDSEQMTPLGSGLAPPIPDIGADVNFGQYFDGSLGLIGHVSAVLYYDRALTDEERQQVEAYLQGKYGGERE